MHNLPDFEFPFAKRIYTAMLTEITDYCPAAADAVNLYRCMPLMPEQFSNLLVYRHFGRYTNEQLMLEYGHSEAAILQLEKEALKHLADMLTDMRNNPQNYPANSGSLIEILANK